MSGNFRICAADGKPFFVTEVTTLQKLYRSGRIDAETPVLLPDATQYRPLNEIFNLAEWGPYQPVTATGAQSTASATAPIYGEAAPVSYRSVDIDYSNEEEEDERPNPGLRAAGVLLLCNCLFVVLKFALSSPDDRLAMRFTMAPVILIVDMVLGGGMVYGKWGKAALFRACVGGIVFGIIVPLMVLTPSAMIIGVFQIIAAVGLLMLMYGNRASAVRLVFGVTVAFTAWLGVQTVVAADFILPKLRLASKYNKEMPNYIIPDRSFNDSENAVSADLPDGWQMVKADNPFIKIPEANVLFRDDNVNACAFLIIHPSPPNTIAGTAEDYVNAITRQKTINGHEYKFIGKYASNFGNHMQADLPQRIELSWSEEGKVFHGWQSIFVTNNEYYVLNAWCLESDQNRVYDEYLKLEAAFTIGPPMTKKVSTHRRSYCQRNSFIARAKLIIPQTARIII